MPAAQKALTIEQGADFLLDITWEEDGEPVDITGFEFAGQIRTNVDAANPSAEFVFTITDATAGKFTMSLGNAITEALSLPAATAVYDVEAQAPGDGGLKYRLLRGTINFIKEVTR